MDEFQVLSFMLVLSRVSAFIGFFPLFGQHQIPVMVKAGLATALTVFWYGTIPVSPYLGQEISTLLAVLLIAQEVGIGLLLAMMLGFLLLPARIAGSYIGQEIGISMEPVTNSGSEQSTMMASIFESLAILLFWPKPPPLYHSVFASFDEPVGEQNQFDGIADRGVGEARRSDPRIRFVDPGSDGRAEFCDGDRIVFSQQSGSDDEFVFSGDAVTSRFGTSLFGYLSTGVNQVDGDVFPSDVGRAGTVYGLF